MLKTILNILVLLAVIGAIFPYLPIEHWSVTMFDFPKMQLALLTLIAMLAYYLKFNFDDWRDYSVVIILAFCFAFQAYKVVPYTKFAPYTMGDSAVDQKKAIGLYNANVLQKNTHHDSLLKDIRRHDPDIVLLLETDRIWENAVHPSLAGEYPHSIKAPLDNTYGMLLYSKLELVDGAVHYMVEDTIPSIHTKVVSKGGDQFQLIAIHPTPPAPTQAETSVDRDAEMMLAARLARETALPVIVMGDFNDVAWSETTELFRHVSTLIDPRNGRGLFNTFNAHNWIIRWPLDHIFTSADFRLRAIARGEKIGSDHFPYYVELTYEPELAAEQEPKPPTEKHLERAFQQILKEERETSQ